MAPQTSCDFVMIVAQQNRVEITAKCAFKNYVKLLAKNRAGASFGQQTHIGQPNEVKGLRFARHTETHENRS